MKDLQNTDVQKDTDIRQKMEVCSKAFFDARISFLN
jgi:hypothetical protein